MKTPISCGCKPQSGASQSAAGRRIHRPALPVSPGEEDSAAHRCRGANRVPGPGHPAPFTWAWGSGRDADLGKTQPIPPVARKTPNPRTSIIYPAAENDTHNLLLASRLLFSKQSRWLLGTSFPHLGLCVLPLSAPDRAGAVSP